MVSAGAGVGVGGCPRRPSTLTRPLYQPLTQVPGPEVSAPRWCPCLGTACWVHLRLCLSLRADTRGVEGPWGQVDPGRPPWTAGPRGAQPA